jgi:multidrug efflux pump subunit AcrB
MSNVIDGRCVAVSIPLSVLTSIFTFSALDETINIITLVGLALAVGILADDATAEIENMNSNIEMEKEIEHAIVDGAPIAAPAFVATLSICSVFVPSFFLSVVACYLFINFGLPLPVDIQVVGNNAWQPAVRE